MTNTIDLTAARLNAGHSIRSLAEHLDVHQHTIRRLEAGDSIHPAAAKKIADFYGLKVTDLMPLEEQAGAIGVDT